MSQELTDTQMFIIEALCKKEPRTFKELADELRRGSKVISEAAKLLEAKDFVKIKTAEDRPGRPKLVSLKEKGRMMCKKSGQDSNSSKSAQNVHSTKKGL